MEFDANGAQAAGHIVICRKFNAVFREALSRGSTEEN